MQRFKDFCFELKSKVTRSHIKSNIGETRLVVRGQAEFVSLFANERKEEKNSFKTRSGTKKKKKKKMSPKRFVEQFQEETKTVGHKAGNGVTST